MVSDLKPTSADRFSQPTGSDERGSSDRLRALYQKQTQPANREDCPDAEQLTALAQGELEAVEQRRLTMHLAECSDCSAELQALRRSPLVQGESLPRAQPLRKTPARSWLLAATVVLLVGVTASFVLLRSQEPVDGVRASGESPIASQQVLPAPDAVLDTAPRTLAWDIEGPYSLRLLTANGDVLAEALGDGKSLALNTAHPRAYSVLEQGGRFLWTVATPQGSLGPFWFEVTPQDTAPQQDSSQ